MNPETLIMTLLFWGAVLFIVYTYFGYPIIIFLLAQLKPEATYCTETFPSVTFLIAAYNEELVIPQKIENTLQLDYPRDKLQIIVAADGSSDKTAELVRNFSDRGVELSYIPERGGKMAAIVRAMPLTRGEIVIFSDANNMYESQAVRILVAPFCDSSIGLTTGAKLIIDDQRNLSSAEGLYWKYESWIKKNETILGTCTNSVGEIMAIRRELFIPPVEKIINDDHYMVLDMIHRGYRVVYTPQARSFEYVSQTAKDEIVRRVRMNAGLYQTIAMSGKLLPFNRPLLLWKIISHKFFRAFVPFAMLIAFFSNLILVLMHNKQVNTSFWMVTLPFNQIFIILQLFFYAVAILGNFVKFHGLLGKIFYLPTYLVNSNLATFVGFHSFLTNKQLHVWERVRR